MKNDKLKRMLLPIGLLCATGVPMIGHLIKMEVPDSVDGFFKGVGIALLLCSLFLQRCAGTLSKTSGID
jgi:hypothetical protein